MLTISYMVRRDLPAVMDIERRSFDQPLSEDMMIDMLRDGNVRGKVVKRGGQIVGYMIYHRDGGNLILGAIAVDFAERRRGHGGAMIGNLIAKLGPDRKRILTLVPDDNLDAQLFFRSLGFRATGIDGRMYPMEFAIAEGCIIER